jgi:SAM-dependent methyltransferase
MYQSIFDYQKEFQFYDTYLKKFSCKTLLEIGCGSGNLAPFFLEEGYDYTGLDLYEEMIEIAREVEPRAHFVQGDMRQLQVPDRFDAILITGRSFAHLITNEEVMNTLHSVHHTLNREGLFLFDSFNAEHIFKDFRRHFTQTATCEGREYRRVSTNTRNLKTGWAWNWNATYYIKEEGNTKIIEDTSVLRGFTEDELSLFLHIHHFTPLNIHIKGSAIIVIAQKF